MPRLLLSMLLLPITLAWPQNRDVQIREAPGGGGGDRWAVVVGVDQYERSEISTLRCAAKDAQDFAAALQTVGGFAPENVKLLVTGAEGDFKPNAANVVYWLGWLRQNAKAADTVVFFFAGHGFSSDGVQYLLPIEADTRNPSTLRRTCLRLTEVRQELDGIEAQRVVVFIDACRNEPRADRAEGDNRMTAEMEEALRGQARAVYYACSVGERSFERADVDNGVFTHYLLQGLGGKAAAADGYVDLLTLKAFVDGEMLLWNRDHPDKAMTPWLDLQCSGRVVLSRGIGSGDFQPVLQPALVSVHSDPAGAAVSVDGKPTGQMTPCTVEVVVSGEAPETHEIAVSKEGYAPRVRRGTLVSGVRAALDMGKLTALQPAVAVAPPEPAAPAPAAPSGRPWEREGTRAGEEITGPDGGTYVWVPPGEFMMGSEDGFDNEKPVHKVRITKGYWLSKCEVTNAQYKVFCEATGHRAPEQADWGEPVWRNGGYPSEMARHPVVCVSWEDATAYCEHYGLRLPTEAEWEYAARGSKGTAYPWGNEWDQSKCCSEENTGPGGQTYPVGSFPAGASWCGALDLAGNVWEWCGDWYDTGDYQESPEIDPKGPQTGQYRVVRGGGWYNNATPCRSASRARGVPSRRSGNVGLRPVLVPR